MASIAVGEVPSWIDIANEVERLVQEVRGRSDHLKEFTECVTGFLILVVSNECYPPVSSASMYANVSLEIRC